MNVAALRELAEALPPGAAVSLPREWLLELLAPVPAQADASPPTADLTCRDVGTLLGRADSTVRGWLDAGVLEGYRMRGREWRVTRSALARFKAEESKGKGTRESSVVKRGKATDLAAWRRVS